MGMYRRTFAVPHKGQHVGDLVELTDDEAGPMLAFGRVVRAETDEPAKSAPKGRKPATAPAQANTDAGGDA
ncbi:hypothetical protein PBI_HUFFY_17 [Gordonia phage Huffy]|nr:hypothetical protein PBI_HUFFY_17 [Gordonia phage Huffy]AQY55701.1 hypothetical protein PBI_DINODARYN_17 [Gordonia phage DinoDaryn]